MVVTTRWEGVNEKMAKMVATANLDYALERRRIRGGLQDVQLGIDHCLFKARYDGIEMKESYELNSRGIEIFCKQWLPESSPIKSLVFFCHGYGDTCTFFVEGIAKKIASSGHGGLPWTIQALVFRMDFMDIFLVLMILLMMSSSSSQMSKKSQSLKGLPSFFCLVNLWAVQLP
ncbi:hypothetical protein HPP92_006394 [Vanilla planifolia]|uniref:Uncharacterized protein n=1 Tax=Vanilla planifolia TaxID=51239 RepID=A0A835RIY8_VANPL|nr:hypothetical protein HPP92_006394 [Vanilla planifolia]